jgi:hypothetical protein
MRVVGYIPKPRNRGNKPDSENKKKPEKAASESAEKAEEPRAEEAKEDSEA